MATTKRDDIKWAELLTEAVEKPGLILEAYSNFHNYSFGNCVLALVQCHRRGIAFGPISTYKKWNTLGRQVRRGEKGIELCIPQTIKSKTEVDASGEPKRFTRFIYKKLWFVISQTDGDAVEFATGPEWDKDTALTSLNISEIPFDHPSGNTQGYAKAGRKLAINPVAQVPYKTLFHELGHIVLGHCDDKTLVDDASLTKNLIEAEAEAVALICLEALGLDGADYCRGYIQNWLKGAEIPEKSASRIFGAAEKILRAGVVSNEDQEAA